MKTPEEIKKGLDHCGEDGCKDCPYVQDCTMMDGFSELAKDSLAYIKQLEEGIEQWEYVAASPGAVEDMARENVQMEAEIDRQRDKIRVLELSLQAVNDGNAALQRENLMLEAQVPRWISVEEKKPPRHMGEYLCWCALDDDPEHKWDWAMVLRWHAIEGNGIVDRPNFTDEGVNGMYVTHWMPLPEPPEATKP